MRQSRQLQSASGEFERFARWLCPRGGPDPAAYDPASLGRFIQTLWQVSPLLESRLPDDIPEHAEIVTARETAAITRLHGEICSDQIDIISGMFDAATMPYVLLKSAATRWICYDTPSHRCGRDIDLAVPLDRVEEARHLFLEAGYRQAIWDEETRTFNQADPGMTALTESTHHELGFLVLVRRVEDLDPEIEAAIRKQIARRSLVWALDQSDRILHYAVVDLHHGLSPEIGVEESLVYAETIQANGRRLRIQPRDWLLFFLVYKLYWEGVHRYRLGAYQYADIIRLVSLLDADGIERFCARIEHWKLEAAAYFTLRRLPMVFGVELPEALMEKVIAWGTAPVDLTPQECNDYGDVWSKLWGRR